MYASGVASDAALARAFEPLRELRGRQLSSRYYHARAVERLGRTEEAQAEYHEVSLMDVGVNRYYGTWAEARLSGIQQLAAASCPRDALGACLPETGLMPRLPKPSAAAEPQPSAAMPSVSAVFASERDSLSEAISLRYGLPTKSDLRRETIVARLGALAAVHGAAYPWIARAADLAELERYDDAASEISETYLAYRDARGGFRFRVGVESVLTNTTPPPHLCSAQTRRDRLALDEWARLSLAEVADMLEEPGVAVRLREQRVEVRPRPYAADVERAAAKFSVDPNLLYAVMRVESVYYRQIVSFAGAVGLMQIMPQTGMRIARALGNTDFNPRELLDARKNLEFAAWYLGSLINRFDGRVPLAIAAYNGGPHNVRLWMRAYPTDMPLDAFLERIPFKETHNYVRRVLTHYAAYRAQQNLAMLNLADTLPRPRPDAIAF
jgi:soluble lytic murein transglycosylase-like protein